MFISVFDIFKIGIGPSSSHTVGPMKACGRFLEELGDALPRVVSVVVELYGSLGSTGKGHGTHKAVMLGLSGEKPDAIESDAIDGILQDIESNKEICLAGRIKIAFDPETNIVFFRKKTLSLHSNGIKILAYDSKQNLITEKVYFSIGGGFVKSEAEMQATQASVEEKPVPFPFDNAKEMLATCAKENISISQMIRANELTRRSAEEIDSKLDHLWAIMSACIDRGCLQSGVLPGRLKVERRAGQLFKDLKARPKPTVADPLVVLDWVNLFAIAVNEENASGSRIVSAPTNGAAGIIPAVLRYFHEFSGRSSPEALRNYLLTAAAIGTLFLKNASISGAEVGCQGEVGVACSMAAAGLTEVWGGTPEQVEEAAEIAMEHNLGLTCDPIGGLVQIPCIERNAMGSVKAINAARIAFSGDGKHFVSLDSVIRTMKKTGADMKTKYKETSRGGLAVNVVEC